MAADRHGDEFANLASGSDDALDLGRAALLLSRDEYPNLDVAGALKRLDMLAAGVAERMPPSPDSATQLEVLSDYLFNQRRFRGNAADYYEASNSYLSEVLDRRLGIPISLSILAIEVGKRAGVTLYGVGLPGHFVVRHGRLQSELFLDPFNGGRILSATQCHEIAMQYLRGQAHSFGHYLEPVSTRAVLARMLSNLKLIYYRENDAPRALRVLDRILQVFPNSANDHKERGLLHFAGHRYRAALSDLTMYLAQYPDGPDAVEIHDKIEEIWQALNTGL